MFGFKFVEAEIISLPNNGILVEYRVPIVGSRLTWLKKTVGLSLHYVEHKDVFAKIIAR